MLDLNNLPKQKHEDLCKIIDYVLGAAGSVLRSLIVPVLLCGGRRRSGFQRL